MGTSGQRFSRRYRLPHKGAFDRVFNQSRRSSDDLFTVLYRCGPGQHARLGLAISKKRCPRATRRNRLKRIIRESFRYHKILLAGKDIVVLNKATAHKVSNKVLYKSLVAHWHRCQYDGRGNRNKG